MARDLRSHDSERMATRVNLMKLLQEVRGLSEIAIRRPARPLTSALLPLRVSPRPVTLRRRRTIKIAMLEPIDIPAPVIITHLKRARSRASSRS
jgi:hypothetical protein